MVSVRRKMIQLFRSMTLVVLPIFTADNVVTKVGVVYTVVCGCPFLVGARINAFCT